MGCECFSCIYLREIPLFLALIPSLRRTHNLKYGFSNLSSEKWWNSVSNLDVLFGPVSYEEIVVGKRLHTRCLANSQASALGRIVVDEVMAVF